MLNYHEILRVLAKHEVDFILVGGLSAVLQGVPLTTLDIDIVHSRRPDNLQRLILALRELDASYWQRPDKKLQPNESHLIGAGHQLLITSFGRLDVLGAIGDGLTYEDLLEDTVRLEMDAGFAVSTLNLEKYLELKEQLSRDKDQAALPTLRAALKEKRKIP